MRRVLGSQVLLDLCKLDISLDCHYKLLSLSLSCSEAATIDTVDVEEGSTASLWRTELRPLLYKVLRLFMDTVSKAHASASILTFPVASWEITT